MRPPEDSDPDALTEEELEEQWLAAPPDDDLPGSVKVDLSAVPWEPSAPAAIRHRVQLPLIRNGHPASPGEEMTPDRVAQILIEDEARWASEAGKSS